MKALRLFAVAGIENGDTQSLAEGTSVVHYREVAAVVEPAEYGDTTLDENGWDRYTSVIEAAFRHGPLLPAPPGTVFKSKGTLSHWLELHYFTLTDALSLLEGQVAGRVMITTGQTVTDADATKSMQALGAESLRILRGHAGATVVQPLDDEDEKDGVVVRASFLVPADRWKAFEDSVSAETKRQPALNLRLSGPWPPYDFVRMQFGG